MVTEEQEFQFDKTEGGKAVWTLETRFSDEDISFVIDEVCSRVWKLQFDETGKLILEVADDTISLRQESNHDHHLGYTEETDHDIWGKDIIISANYPVANSDVNPRTKIMAGMIVKAIFAVIDDLGARDKLYNSSLERD